VITKIIAREVLDSRGNPTLETEVFAGTESAKAMVPSGASTGSHEALELRDNDNRYMGKGVLKAIKNVEQISLKLTGMDVREQAKLDSAMIEFDGTANKSLLGANAMVGVSMASARLAARLLHKELFEYISELAGTKAKPVIPFANVINGGRHAGNELAIQEFMIVPQSDSTPENVRMVSEVYHTLKKLLKEKYGPNSINVGDEGGFAPPLKSGEDALKLLTEAIAGAGYEGKVKIAVDAAASEFYSDGKYSLEQPLSKEQLAEYWGRMVGEFNIVLLEDPFAEDDFEGFKLVTEKLGKKLQIMGDDLLVTNVSRIKLALKEQLCNSLLLKVNQIGTLTEAINAAKLAFENGWKVMVSHRSGETDDAFIADLAVGLGCGQLKCGAPARGERTAKYNRLLRISERF